MDGKAFWAWYFWIPSIVGSVASLWTLWQCWEHRHRFNRLRFAYLAVAMCALGYYSLSEVSILIVNHTEYGSPINELWIAPALLAVLLSLIGLVPLGFAIVWSCKWYLFRRIFGETPPSSNEESQHKKETVDSRLQWLARWMKQMFDFESALLREVSKDWEAGSEKSPELEETRQWVAAAKKRFWLAHNLAKFHGFAVHSSYKDYLPEKSGSDSPVLRRV